jgi:hypothetical protein
VDEDSSNFREFENVVCALEEEALEGHLHDAIAFLCTNNSTVEAGLAKGNSTSRKFFELILRIRLLQMKTRCQIVVTHVSGKQMVAQGTDGVLQGHPKEGVSTGEDMLKLMPLHLSVFERSDTLQDWILLWLGNQADSPTRGLVRKGAITCVVVLKIPKASGTPKLPLEPLFGLLL